MNDLDDDSDESSRFDDMLMAILQHKGQIQPFLDTIFKFLYKRTDFFVVQETSDQPYGFAPGVAKQIAAAAFNKYDAVSKEKLKDRLLKSNIELANKETKVNPRKPPTQQQQKQQQQAPQASASQLASTLQATSVSAQAPAEVKKQASAVQEATTTSATSADNPLEKQQKVFQANPASYNGAIRDSYSWTQTIKDLDVTVKINEKIQKSKDVQVKIEKSSLRIVTRDSTGAMTNVIINDNLPWKVRPDECTWSLFPGDHIHIYLEKVDERWWEKLLEGETALDLKHMHPEKPLDELDEEAQAKIRQMMHDERQKRLGLPTSEEQKNLDILQKAWNAENSPFKGTPFDPSVLQGGSGLNINEDPNLQ